MSEGPETMLLAGDIGGTKTRLGLYQPDPGGLECRVVEQYPSGKIDAFPALLRRFLEAHPATLRGACLGAPGPVRGGQADPTHLEWDLDEAEVRQVLGMDAVRVVNDLVATAAAVPHLKPEHLATLHEGSAPDRSGQVRCVVLAPGTGLGQAFLVRHEGAEPSLFPSEGGHADFAPTTATENRLWQFLARARRRVTWEQVVSGPGLENVYAFLIETKYGEPPDGLAERLREEDPAKVISESAQKGEHEICVETLELFATLLGSRAGNLALTFRANGGVFLGGGIPPRILDVLRKGPTVRAFLNKDPMEDLMKRIPLRVILDDHAALLGAAHLAAGPPKGAG